MLTENVRHLFNNRRRVRPSGQQTGASAALAAARIDDAKGLRAYASSPWTGRGPRFAFHAVGGTSADSVRWVETPSNAGLRFVGYCDMIARHIQHTGWFTDPHGHGKIRGVVYQLPGRNGKARFVAGYDNEDNGAADCDGPARVDFSHIFEEDARSFSYPTPATDHDAARDAAYAADSLAEREAESEREYQTAWQAGSLYAELGNEARELRRKALSVLAARRAAMRDEPSVSIALLAAEARNAVESIAARLCDIRAERAALKNGDAEDLYFYPSAELAAAFNEGAGL